MAEGKIDLSKVSEEDKQAAVRLLQKTREQRTKYAQKLKSDPEAKKKAHERSLKLRIKDQLLKEKALKAGIKVEDKEVEAEIKKRAKV